MKAKKIVKKSVSKKTVAKPAPKKPVTLKKSRSASAGQDVNNLLQMRKVKVTVPVEVMKEIRSEAKQRGIPVDAMVALRISVNVMLGGLSNKSEYENAIRFVELKYHVKIDRSTIPAYKKGGDPEYKKWHDEQMAKKMPEKKSHVKKTSKGQK